MAKKTKNLGRKVGRNKTWCANYLSRGTRTKNKIRHLKKRIKDHPNDLQATKDLQRVMFGKLVQREAEHLAPIT